MEFVTFLEDKLVRDKVLSELKIPSCLQMIPLEVGDFQSDFSGVGQSSMDKLTSTFPGHELIARNYIKRNGLVLKPLHGCAGVGVVFLIGVEGSTTRGCSWITKNNSGKIFKSIQDLLSTRATYSVEPYISNCRSSEQRLFGEIINRSHLTLHYGIESKLNGDGETEVTSPMNITNKHLKVMGGKVMKTFNEVEGYPEMGKYKKLVLRVDCFQSPFNEKKFYVNEVDVFPIASTFIHCGFANGEHISTLVNCVVEFVVLNADDWPP